MRRRSGFTLIELLVVIAIIALLMAILMPALSRVKKQAQTVACMSNVKQWSLCWHMYLEDSGGLFPGGDVLSFEGKRGVPFLPEPLQPSFGIVGDKCLRKRFSIDQNDGKRLNKTVDAPKKY